MSSEWLANVTAANQKRRGQSLWNNGLHVKHEGSFENGPLHWNWRGGITPSDKINRRTPEYKAWRKATFERND
jgi:hypothetical protein